MPVLDRRHFFAASAAGLALAAAPMGQRRAQAHGDPRAAGFHRFTLGGMEALAISDGTLALGGLAASSPGAPEDEVAALAAANRLSTENLVVQATCFALNTEGGWMLFDVGSGAWFQDSAGRLIATLGAAGIAPADIATIAITHLHPDHAYGLVMKDQTPAFPKARYVVGDAEYAFWTDPGTREKFPEAYRFLVDGAQRSVAPLDGALTRLRDGDTAAPGVTAMLTPGHTPGHIAFRIERGGESLILTGDVATHHVLSLSRPDWAFSFDVDAETAARTRKDFLAMVAEEGVPILSYHFPFPGVGHVVTDGAAYRFIPATV